MSDKKNITNRKIFSIYLFSGQNQHSKNQKIEEIKKTVLSEINEFNFDLLYADDIEPKKVIEIAETMPFCSDKRLIILKNFENYSSKQKMIFSEYSNNPASMTCLILDANERQDKRESWHKVLDSNKDFVQIEVFWQYQYKDLLKIIIDIFSKKGKNIDYEASSVLAELIETNPSTLDEEIQKILDFVGDKNHISLTDIKENVVKTQNHDLYEWAIKITKKDFNGAIKFLNNLSPKELKAPQLLFYTLTERFIKISKYLTMISEGVSSADAQKFLGILYFLDPNFHKQAISFDFEKLNKIFNVIIEADFFMKTGQGFASNNSKFLFEKLILDIKFILEGNENSGENFGS